MMSCPSRPDDRGFTVMELMVVLVIGSALVALLFGALHKAGKPTRLAEDMMKLRTFGAAFHLYVIDHNQRLPNQHGPIPVKTLAWQLGYTQKAEDWSNDSASNSIFRNGADETAIRKLFTSAYDNRAPTDPIGSFASNDYIGMNPAGDPSVYHESAYANTYPEIRQPHLKIYLIPGYFMPRWHSRFSGATTTNPFITQNNPADKGEFPALFVDGHVAIINPNPPGMTLSQINRRWLLPKSDP